MTRAFVLLTAIACLFVVACTGHETTPGPSGPARRMGPSGPPPTEHVPQPTATPAPRFFPSIRTSTDMQDRFESHPDGYKFRIDEDTVVVFAYPSEFIDWAWQASINHMPSVSAVSIHRPRTVISPDGSSTTEGCEELFGQPIYIERHYENEEGRAQLEWILADQETMKNVIARLPR